MAQSIDLGVTELLLASKPASLRSVRVRVKAPAGIVSAPLETTAASIMSASQPVKFDWQKSIPVTRGGRSWLALQKALEHARSRPGAAQIEFVLVDATVGKDLGTAVVDLSQLVGASSEDEVRRVHVEDSARRAVGTLVVRVRALDAVRLVSSGGDAGGASVGGDGVSEDVRRAFNRFDADGSGDIDATELHAALRVLGMDASGAQARAIQSRYTTGRGGTLTLQDFNKLVRDLKAHTGSDPVSPPRAGGVGSGGVDAKIKAAFDAFDTDGSGDIDATELRGALKRLGMATDAAGTDAVLRRYSANRTLSLPEFAKLVADLQRFSGKEPATPGGGAGGGSAAGIASHIREAFAKFDTDGSGGIDRDEMMVALQQLGMSATGSGAQQIINKYAGPGVREINLTQFDKLVRDLERFHGGSPLKSSSSSPSRASIEPRVRAAFEAFDADGSGGIDKDELVEALRQLGMAANPAQARDVMRKYDVDRRGTLDLAQFDKLVRDLSRFQTGKELGSATPGGGGGFGGAGVEARVQRAFDRYDTNNDRYLDAYELQLALKELGLSASAAQVRDVLARYDARKADGKLDVKEFGRLVKDLEAYQAGGKGAGTPGGAYTDPNVISANVRTAFERFDTDGNGKIDATELRHALRQLGVDATSDQAVRVLQRYDIDRSGGIELREFARLTADIVEHQAGGKGGVPSDVRKAFADFDRDRNGSIDAHELRLALQALGIDADAAQAKTILQQYDADRNLSLDVDEFARLVGDIRGFQESGRREAIVAQLKRDDVVQLLKNHQSALDELFNAFALEAEDAAEAYGILPTGDAFDAEVRAAFAAYDRDASGGIDASELVGALAKLGLQASEGQTRKVLGRYDADDNKQLDLPEFSRLVSDLRSYQGGGAPGGGGSGAGAGTGAGGGEASSSYPKVLDVEELLSMLHGFRLIPKQLSVDDVKAAVKEMQTSATVHVVLQPFPRAHFPEVLLRLAHFAAAKTTATRNADAAQRLDALLRSMLLYDVGRMRHLVAEHRLREACSVGDVEVVKTLIAQRVAIDAIDHERWTALHRACCYGHEDCLRELLAAGASLPQRGPSGYTAMHFAAEFGHLRVVHMLLDAGAAPADLSDETGWTALQRAAIDGHTAVVSALLRASVDKRTGRTLYPLMSRDKEGDTALHDAARNGHLGVVRELIAAKADLDAPNHNGQTALDVARKAGRREVAELLQIHMRNKGLPL